MSISVSENSLLNGRNLLEVQGTQEFMGHEIPVVSGGFGKDKKCISDKTIAEIHDMETKHVRENINNNIRRFKEGVDYIDLKTIVGDTDHEIYEELGYNTAYISRTEHIYILSERGYGKLIKIFDTDLAWEIYDKMLDEYFTMKEKSQLEILQDSIALLVEQERRMKAVERKMSSVQEEVTEIKAQITTHNTDYYTIAGYASIRGLNVDISKATILGRKAASMSKRYGYEVSKVHDTRFGKVNAYHVDVLKNLFENYNG